MKRELRYYRPRRTSDYTRIKIVTKGKLIDRLINRESTNLQKSTLSHSDKGRRNATSRTLAMGPCNLPKRGSIIEDKPNIQDIRCRVVSSKGIY